MLPTTLQQESSSPALKYIIAAIRPNHELKVFSSWRAHHSHSCILGNLYILSPPNTPSLETFHIQRQLGRCVFLFHWWDMYGDISSLWKVYTLGHGFACHVKSTSSLPPSWNELILLANTHDDLSPKKRLVWCVGDEFVNVLNVRNCDIVFILNHDWTPGKDNFHFEIMNFQLLCLKSHGSITR